MGALHCEMIASVRWLLKHYRLWNDGLRPGIGPPRRKEGSRRGRPTIVIIATPLSTSLTDFHYRHHLNSHYRHHSKPPFNFPSPTIVIILTPPSNKLTYTSHLYIAHKSYFTCYRKHFTYVRLEGFSHRALPCVYLRIKNIYGLNHSPFFLLPAHSSSLLFAHPGREANREDLSYL